MGSAEGQTALCTVLMTQLSSYLPSFPGLWKLASLPHCSYSAKPLVEVKAGQFALQYRISVSAEGAFPSRPLSCALGGCRTVCRDRWSSANLGAQILIRAARHLSSGWNSDCPREPAEAESQDFQGGLRKQSKKPEDQTAGPSFLSMSRTYPAFPGSTCGQLQLQGLQSPATFSST